MFDTMTLTKITAAICSALLIFVLGSMIADGIYSGAGGHGDDHEQAYVIDTGAETSGGDEAAEADQGPTLAELLAAADAEKGAKVFRKCGACHKLEDGKNGTGPHLFGVVDRAVGSVEGFGYSGKLVAVADVWNAENLDAFIANPKGFAPGTKMSFSGIRKPADRADLIAYLQTIGQ